MYLLPDQRILAFFDSWVGLYSRPVFAWTGAGTLPTEISEEAPLWRYFLQAIEDGYLMGLSKPQVSAAGIASVLVYDKIGWHRVCVNLDGSSVPKVTIIHFNLPDECPEYA